MIGGAYLPSISRNFNNFVTAAVITVGVKSIRMSGNASGKGLTGA